MASTNAEMKAATNEIVERLRDMTDGNFVVRSRRRTPTDVEGDNANAIKLEEDQPDPAKVSGASASPVTKGGIEDGTVVVRPGEWSTLESPFSCDRCDQCIDDIRMNCQDCPNFDYCPGCFIDASRIHPGHKFKALKGQEDAPAGNYKFHPRPEFVAIKDKTLPLLRRGYRNSPPEHACRSCAPLKERFAVWNAMMQKCTGRRTRLAVLEETKFNWTVRVTSLTEATALGCAFCSYFLKKMFGPHEHIGFSYRTKKRWLLKDEIENKDRNRVLTRAMELSSRLPNDRFVFRVKPVLLSKTAAPSPWLEKIVLTGVGASCDQTMIQECFGVRGAVEIELLAFALAETVATQDARVAPNATPDTTESLAHAKSWLTACFEKHGPLCLMPASQLPTRVIDVCDESQYRIVETKAGDEGTYCALSYQWGGPQKFHLTTENLSKLKDSFPSNDLPQTIADAAKVVRGLGVRYLWVDALCILQDNAEDKIHEISHMENIYRYSTVTIIAASSTSASSGFLKPNTDDDLGFWCSLIPLLYPVIKQDKVDFESADVVTQKSNSQADWGEMLFMDDMEVMDYGTTKDPVTSRSWCLQERLVSPRVLNYGRWPTWRCNKCIESDGGYYIDSDPGINTSDEFARLLSTLYRQNLGGKIDHFVLNKLLRAWYGIVTDYSKRKLSSSLDRLPAINGVAKIISDISGMQYVAGLWRNNLLHDLTWYSNSREWLTRPAISRAPTWSWASIDYIVSYAHINDDSKPLAQVLQCVVQSSAMGVVSGHVEVKGLLRELSSDLVLELFKTQDMAPAVQKKATLVEFYKQLMESMEDNQNAKNFPEEEVKETLPQSIYALLMFEHSQRILDGQLQEGLFYSGLLLQKVNGGHERIGGFRQERQSWLNIEDNVWQEQIVTIH